MASENDTSSSTRPATGLRPCVAARAASALLLGLGIMALTGSLGWRGARFPGFFLMPNRVVPSAGLPGWNGVAEGRPPYQQVLLAVDGKRIGSSAEGYGRVAAHADGAMVPYLFARDGRLQTRSFPVRTLRARDYVAVFGMYFVTGLAYLLLAVMAAERWQRGALYRGLAVLGWVGAAFSFTGMDLYGPGRLFRLHVLAEACLPAATLHLALVCPRDALRERRGVLPLVYGLSLALAAVYEIFLDQPRAYSAIHNLCQALSAIPAFGLVARIALALDRPPAGLGADALARLLAASIAGFVVPGIVLGISGATGGVMSVTMCAWMGFLFPLGCLAAFWRLSAPAGGAAGVLGPAHAADAFPAA
jgi:hypothetical protein